MPVILARRDFSLWLDERAGSVKNGDAALLDPVPDPAGEEKPAPPRPPKQGSLF